MTDTTPTPMTDALLLELNEGRVYETDSPLADFARSLERSLAAAQALLRRFLDFHMEPAGLTKEIVDDKDAFMAFLERADTAQLSLLKDTRFFLTPQEGERDG
jgi:hypothetical protein